MAQNSNGPKSQENYISQISEEIEERVTKMLSQEFSITENRKLGTLARLDVFVMNPLIQGHSGTPPGTSQNTFGTSQGTNEDDSQSDPHPEAGIFNNQTTQNSGPEDRHVMVTGVTGDIRNRHELLTGVHEEVTYGSPSTSSGKQKKNRSINQPQFRSKIPLRRLKWTTFCWHFSSWHTTTILQISIRILTQFPTSHSRS